MPLGCSILAAETPRKKKISDSPYFLKRKNKKQKKNPLNSKLQHDNLAPIDARAGLRWAL
jgi:hypothetical protein